MNQVFFNFLQQSLSEEFWQSPPNVICFYGKTLPGFFLQKWRARVSEIIKTKFIHLACEKKRVPVELQQQSFLTEKRFYWLGEVKQQAVLQSVAGKDSGRCMVLFTEEKIASLWNKLEHVFVLEIIDSIDMYNGEAFLKLFYPKLLPAVHLFILKMVEHFHSISLDHFVSLVRYVEVAGLRNKTELTYCCDEVLEQNSSLKFISDTLLSMKPRQFFTLWDSVAKLYSVPFWVSFFNRLFWDVAGYVELMERGDRELAQRIRFRFPKTFYTGGWKRFPLKVLEKVFKELYAIDYGFKSGIRSEHGIECLFAKIFVNNVGGG